MLYFLAYTVTLREQHRYSLWQVLDEAVYEGEGGGIHGFQCFGSLKSSVQGLQYVAAAEETAVVADDAVVVADCAAKVKGTGVAFAAGEHAEPELSVGGGRVWRAACVVRQAGARPSESSHHLAEYLRSRHRSLEHNSARPSCQYRITRSCDKLAMTIWTL